MSAGTFHIVATNTTNPSARATATATVTPGVLVSIDPEQVTLMAGGAPFEFKATVTGAPDLGVTWSMQEASAAGAIDASGTFVPPNTPGTFHVVATSAAVPVAHAVATVVVTPPIAVAIDPATATLTVGGQPFQFKASINGTSDTAVIWSIDNAAGGCSIDATGTFRPSTVPGIFRIIVASHADPSRTATAVATVIKTTSSGVTITPQATTVSPLATVTFSANVSATWSADGGTMQQDGTWTAPEAAGDYHITARSTADTSQAATATATVVQQQVSITVVPAHVVEGQYGPAIQYTAHVTGTTDTSVEWSIASPAAKNTIDANGLFIPGGDVGWFQIVATSRADPSKKATADVTFKLMLKDDGGPIESNTRTFVLWWGDPQAFAPDARPALESFLKGLDGSGYLAILDQYMRGAKAATTFSGSFVDTSAPPDSGDGVAMATKICSVADSNGLTLGDGDVFFVATANYPASSACAWHSFMTNACHGRAIVLAYIPNPQNGHCDTATDGCGTGYSAAGIAMQALAGHELLETITDPFGSAWGWNGQEVVDVCGELACTVLADGKTYQLQTVYSNAALSCVSR